MPRIPQVLADPAGLGRRAVPRDMGGGEGMAALGQTATELGDISLELFEQEMTAKVSGALGEATRALNDLSLEVDAEPDHHKRNQMYAEGSGKIANQFREGLRYPKFQGLFDERMAGTLERGRMGIAQGVRQAQVDTSRANVLENIEAQTDALQNIYDPVSRQAAIRAIHDEIDQGTSSGLWSAVKGAELKIALDNRLEGEELIAQSQRVADEIMDTFPTAEQRMEAALKLPKGVLRDAVVNRVESRQRAEDGLTAKAARAQHTGLLERAMGGLLTQEQLLEESIRLSAAGTPLDPEVFKSVSGVIAGKAPPTPYTRYAQLIEQSRDPITRPEFLALDLTQYADELKDGQLEKLLTNQGKGAWVLPSDATTRVSRALAKLKLPITLEDIADATDDDRAKAEQFRAVAENALMQVEHKKGSPLTGKETQDTIDALFDEVVIDHSMMGWHEKVPLWRIAPATQTAPERRPLWESVQEGYIEMGSAGLVLEDVPPAVAAAIRQQLGQDLTDEEVRERYLEALLGRQSGGMR